MSHGQQPNAVDRVIVDPGDKGMEGKNPGLLYMAGSQCQEQPPLAMLATTTAVSREGDGKTQQSLLHWAQHDSKQSAESDT